MTVANNGGNVEIWIRGVGSSNNTELGDPTEGMLAAALQYRIDGTCPTVSPKTTPDIVVAKGTVGNVASTTKTPEEDFLANNRDMRQP